AIYPRSLHDALPISTKSSAVKDAARATAVATGSAVRARWVSASQVVSSVSHPGAAGGGVGRVLVSVVSPVAWRIRWAMTVPGLRSEEHTSELQSRFE